MKKVALFCILFMGTVLIYAGDIANYVNLGFSQDSKIFMFGQYGLQGKDTKAYADLYTVDVHRNVFVKDGVLEKVFPDKIFPGQDGLGGLFMLLHSASGLVTKYHINHIATGRIVYILVDGDEPKDRLDFRDFDKSTGYVLTLIQEKFGSGTAVRSSFHINLAVTDKHGTTRTFTVGNPSYKRTGVQNYRIKQVLFSPDERSLVIVVEKEKLSDRGKNIRYMVETLPLK